MERILEKVLPAITDFGLDLLYALVVLAVGIRLINWVLKKFLSLRAVQRMDRGVATFLRSFGKIALYVLLVIICCGIIGIPATSFITILASAGVAIGLALQGSLSNFAGGLMILFFKPFRVGDYIESGGVSGTVVEIQTFYTVLMTIDNKRITLPNGMLTNAPVVDYSSEEYRRLDLLFCTSVTHSGDEVIRIIREVVDRTEGYERDREVFVRMSCQTKGQLDFSVRVWCKNAVYWELYYDLNEGIHRAFEQNGIRPPATLVALDSTGETKG